MMDARTPGGRYCVALILLTMSGGMGCVAAAAGAGAGAGIYLTSQGAKSVVNGTVEEVAARARTVLDQAGVALDATSTEKRGAKQELKGKKGDLDITVSLEKGTDATTKTEVSARKNLVEWDKDYARELLANIVKASGT